MIETIWSSFVLVALTEMGDKTQLLALILATRFRRPWAVMAGILVATVFNHTLASYVGVWAAGLVSVQVLKWVLALLFFGFAVWVLIPDKDEDLKKEYAFGAFLTTTVTFFLAEMGDKTQLSTVALAAQHKSVLAVTIGTTMGMLLADGLAVVFGDRLTQKVSMPLIRKVAAVIFILFGILILFK